jgi:hypothetical protein
VNHQSGGILQSLAEVLRLERAILLEQTPAQPAERHERNARKQYK